MNELKMNPEFRCFCKTCNDLTITEELIILTGKNNFELDTSEWYCKCKEDFNWFVVEVTSRINILTMKEYKDLIPDYEG